MLGGFGAAAEGGGGGRGGAAEGALEGVGEGDFRNGGMGGRGARVDGGGGGGGGVPRGGEEGAGWWGAEAAGRLVGAGGGLRRLGAGAGADGADGIVGRRLGIRGGRPEGFGAERGGVVSDVSEYTESRLAAGVSSGLQGREGMTYHQC